MGRRRYNSGAAVRGSECQLAINRQVLHLRFFPTTCRTNPPYCNSVYHWTERGREKCAVAREGEITNTVAEEEVVEPHDAQGDLLRDSQVALDFVIGGGRDKKLEAARAVRVQVAPATPSSRILTNTADRQLLPLGAADLEILSMMLNQGIYWTNSILRSGKQLDGPTGFDTDNGLSTVQEFAAAASGVFSAIGKDLILDAPLTVFRGIGVPKLPDTENPDIAGIRAYLDNRTPLPKQFLDTGFSFATTDPMGALKYQGKDLNAELDVDPVLLVLDVERGICVPHTDLQSDALFEHTTLLGTLKTKREQMYFPRNSLWDVNSIKWNAQLRMNVVHMRQK